ncbi:MAG TPA: [FeFe] hydrogenase H-cluster maturation GTPase HydF [Candidatus Marinimicrobia bacterium]|jgi:[FeFe] hydrogenase H-cluster maturation GTPase HydF|nr:[FeFe] hydrogenase H-cluster maturation GTPase HydF [Candidatus Neomarinimicrobiota bacterium]HPY01359.1 [FeFe] hydrogenase H-cluster maturation GTPase HydF [Candidatus Neomarinimicrobiota bacterium]HQC62220.1 [FeFe] hydrogenase H-cluster maturation GTPase HydF [Candidatus Neomarinimicrobiota bacterium]
MQSTPKSNRLQIGIFGRRNVGKSSLMNALTSQYVSIVSDVAGTTTDPVEKPMELPPLGPVLFIDTAGVDDEGSLGGQRIERTRKILERVDLGIIVAEGKNWNKYEDDLLKELQNRQIPTVVAFNKSDLSQPSENLQAYLKQQNIPYINTIATDGFGVLDLHKILIDTTPADYFNSIGIIGDLVKPGEMAVLVVPIDQEAPKGRLILPQVQTIRDLLDNNAGCIVIKENELTSVLNNLKQPPAIVVTDSQAFLKVAAETPADIPLTSFSILFARYKGDLAEYIAGTRTIDKLKPGDKILIAEACTHHPITDDIGRVKIPRWLNQYVGGQLNFTHYQGHDFPEDLSKYKLVIQCGSCMLNRREVLSRIWYCKQAGVPVTNYGLTIAYTLGIFERATALFNIET